MSLFEDTRMHVLGHAAVAVERAGRRGDTLVVDAEARRLLASYPRCGLSFEELRDRIIILAAKRGVTVEFGSEPHQDEANGRAPLDKSFFDEHTVGFACAACGQKTEKTVGWLKANDTFPCPQCGQRVAVEGRQFLLSARSVDDAVFALTMLHRPPSKR